MDTSKEKKTVPLMPCSRMHLGSAPLDDFLFKISPEELEQRKIKDEMNKTLAREYLMKKGIYHSIPEQSKISSEQISPVSVIQTEKDYREVSGDQTNEPE